jgi:hypothetical protein
MLCLLGLLLIKDNARAREIPVKFIINGNIVSGVKYYLIIERKGTLLPYSDDKITLPDTLPHNYNILLVYKKYHTLITALYSDTEYLEIYFDNRICNNVANRKSGGDWFKIKYLFKRKYLVLYGNGILSISFQSKNNYATRYNIPQYD